jgi:hypothetical protein
MHSFLQRSVFIRDKNIVLEIFKTAMKDKENLGWQTCNNESALWKPRCRSLQKA